MSLRDRVPVEPLEDERLANIERAVITALPTRAPRTVPWRFVVPVATAAVAVAALAMWRAAPRDVAKDPEAPLAVIADADGTRLDLGDAVIVASAGARFQVTRPDGGVDVTLELGKLELEVDKRGDRPPLRVHADDVEVMVIGTRFTVERSAEVTVTVSEGVVRVHRGDDTVTLAAGEAWNDGAKVAAAEPEPDLALEPEVDLLARDREVTAPVEPGTVAHSSGTGTGTGAKRTKPNKIDPVPSDPLDELRKAITSQPIDAADGDTASAALYGAARDEHRKQPRVALRTLDRYIQRFRTGAELDDVLWLRLRIRCLDELDGACRSAAHAYVDKPGGASDKRRIAVRITITTTP